MAKSKLKNGYVYILEKDGRVFYVGSSINKRERMRDHARAHKDCEFTVIEELLFKDKSELILIEMFWIEQFRQWGFKLLNIYGNLSNWAECVVVYKRICIKCSEIISHHHFYTKINGYMHKDCKKPYKLA